MFIVTGLLYKSPLITLNGNCYKLLDLIKSCNKNNNDERFHALYAPRKPQKFMYISHRMAFIIHGALV